MIGNTKKGKMLLNVDAPAKAQFVVPVEGDHVAAIGENRKLLVFPAGGNPGNDARKRRQAATLSRRRPVRSEDFCARPTD